MKVLDGRKIASGILNRLEAEIKKEKITPGLGVVLVGEDEASRIYVTLKQKAAEKIGIHFQLIHLKEEISEGEILLEIKKLNQDSKINGIIVQLPLPGGINKNRIIEALDPEKDVDGFHPKNIQAFFTDAEVLPPVFPEAIFELIKASEEDLFGKEALIICNSDEFGETMQISLKKEGINSGYVHKEEVEANLEAIKKADIIITACGVANLLKGDMFRSGAIIIDGGIVDVEGKIVGDVDFDSTKDLEGFISPVPGGVGPLTIACLLQNVVLASKKSR